MSDHNDEHDQNQRTRELAAQARTGIAGRMTGAGMPAEKAQNFKDSGKRLVRRLRPERLKIALVMTMAIVAVTFSVLGPRLLGNATNTVLRGFFSPQGMDFDELRNTLLFIVGLYVVSASFSWLQARVLAGVVQRTG